MIVFDDYGWTGYRDQKAAADAFLRQFARRTGIANGTGACGEAVDCRSGRVVHQNRVNR